MLKRKTESKKKKHSSNNQNGESLLHSTVTPKLLFKLTARSIPPK